ncbi:hypothetical protein VZT92_016830 [Zoarces viviparus]|uniref:Uncharacterized protein n=1 Tax=Zoarces viviparus TaxID=48416 RepID=A0AAW1EPA6_ZOAVI
MYEGRMILRSYTVTSALRRHASKSAAPAHISSLSPASLLEALILPTEWMCIGQTENTQFHFTGYFVPTAGSPLDAQLRTVAK